MKPFVVEPQAGELKVIVAYSTNLGDKPEKQVAVVGGDEFMVNQFANWTYNLSKGLGQVEFVAGNLYTWRGEVCLYEGRCVKAKGHWTFTELFQPQFLVVDRLAVAEDE